MNKDPQELKNWFFENPKLLAKVTVTGLIYNVGMVAEPWFAGQMAQCLVDILNGIREQGDMVKLAVLYIVVIFIVQGSRYFKRLYVRKFANDLNKDMKEYLYDGLLSKTPEELSKENAGTLMTKGIADVNDCVEGMRKFLTEVFDTGIVMIVYIVMLLRYDWKITLICALFPPVAYWLANMLKKAVTSASAAQKESAGKLNGATLDRVGNALTWRVFGQEDASNGRYEAALTNYENKSVHSGILATSLQPVYSSIAMASTIFIVYFGAKNAASDVWNIAVFTTFLAVWLKLAKKVSTAAKLFNAIQKAEVSWKRICPLMKQETSAQPYSTSNGSGELAVINLGFQRSDGTSVFTNVSFTAEPGQIIGITGAVASGKSMLGRAFLNSRDYTGEITINNRPVNTHDVVYLGHDPQLFADTIQNNIQLGVEGDVNNVLRQVDLYDEVQSFPEKTDTVVGEGGTRLSGGQQARLALARTLYHKRNIIVLDDPFANVDRKTEEEIFTNLRKVYKDSIILLISHRLKVFPLCDQVLYLHDGTGTAGTHAELLKENGYSRLVELQLAGGDLNEAE